MTEPRPLLPQADDVSDSLKKEHSATTLTDKPQSAKYFDLGSGSPHWGEHPLEGEIYHWYQSLRDSRDDYPDGKDPTKIKKVQVWSSSRHLETITHRYVLLHMADGTVHRVDRGAAEQGDPSILSGLSGLSVRDVRGVRSTDEMFVDVKDKSLKEMARDNHLEVEIQLEKEDCKVDLLHVLLACYQISKHPRTQKYDLLHYNCFFYSWTILTVTARGCLSVVPPSQESVMKRFHEDYLSSLAEYLVEVGVRALRDLVLAALAAFRKQEQGSNGEKIKKGMSSLSRMVWALPEGFLETLSKLVLNAKLASNLRGKLLEQIKKVLADAAPDVYKQVLPCIDIPQASQGRLYIDSGAKQIIRGEVEKTVIEKLWPTVVAAITEFENLNGGSANFGIGHTAFPRNSWCRLAGTRITQLYDVVTAALHGGLKKVLENAVREDVDRIKMKAQEDACGNLSKQLELLNEGMFDLAWDSAQDGALQSAKRAVEETKPTLRPKHAVSGVRDDMWDAVWNIWDECWRDAREGARTKALGALGIIVDQVLNTSVKVVLDELRDKDSQPTIQVLRPRRVFGTIGLSSTMPLWADEGPMTGLEFQEYMEQLAKKTKLGGIDIAQATMAEIYAELGKENFDPDRILRPSTLPLGT
ncbi:hypothetical protein PQX77_011934 [Marasmius sp. AFHP31]|nr:hypothetical protein PQX77_011934 [Marasmius sp. AFHP31]